MGSIEIITLDNALKRTKIKKSMFIYASGLKID
jgi:hypothetical protein